NIYFQKLNLILSTFYFPANFPNPQISISPAAVVILGQQVSITCSIAAAPLSGTFILQKTSGSFRMNQSSDSNSASFNIPKTSGSFRMTQPWSSISQTFNIQKVTLDHDGEFLCQYRSRQIFSSVRSDSVHLTGKIK
uniref:Ig-like domain-containing protein n=1 Tax=Poecilia latipinna TaxID=48699 RepID=A0A3B3VWF1_9TELE